MSIDLKDPRVRAKLCKTLWPAVCIMLFKAFPDIRTVMCAKFDTKNCSMFNDPAFVYAFVELLVQRGVTWTQLCTATIEVHCGARFLSAAEMALMDECADIPAGYRGFYHTKSVVAPPPPLKPFAFSMSSSTYMEDMYGIRRSPLSSSSYTPPGSFSTSHSMATTSSLSLTNPGNYTLPADYKLPKLTL
jgi:hypothetical protein